MINNSHSKEKGSALVLAVLAALVLMVTGVGILGLGVRGRIQAIRDSEQVEARCAADAGLEKAVYEMNQQLATNTWGTSSLPLAASQSLPNSSATFDHKVVQGTGKNKADYIASSTGNRGSAQKTVVGLLRLQGPFDSALVVKQTLVMKTGSVVDGYNYENGESDLRVVTLSTLGSQITLGPGSLINGDVAVGVGGDPSVVISASPGSIQGKSYALTEEVWLPSVTVPASIDSLPSAGTIKGPATLTISGKCDTISATKGDIIIDGPVTLYVTGDISLGNSSQMQINKDNPDASLTLFLGGNLYVKNGGVINNLTQDPTRLKIYGLDSCVNLSLAATGAFYGAVYAPEAEMNLKSSVEIYGAVVVKIFNQGSSANFHYDAALRKLTPYDLFTRFVVKRWSEQ